jgi:TP901 family phage tail tape measure protein
MGRTFTASVRRFSALAIATRAVSLFTNTLSSAIEEAISFQQEVVRLSQVTGNSISSLSKLTDEITDLATTLGVSSDKLLTVTTILAQAGLSAEDTRVALSALAKTELAPTFGNITETAEGAVAILAQFKLGAGALEAQLGSLNAVAGKFAVESGDLVEAIRRTGGVFKASGGDLNELISLFTSVRATTRESAATIATGLRTIFTRIQRPKTIEYLKQFGVNLTDLEGKFVGPFEAVRRLSEALAGLEEGDITFVKVAEELGGFRQIGKVIPLLREFATAQAALKVAQEGSGSLAKDQATAQLALAVQITKVKEEFFALVRGFTETSTFRAMADVLLKLASAFIQLAESIKPILPVLTAFAGIRIAQGIGGLMGGILGRARGMSTGGKVLGFARGGMVPGSGNSDTVPAMLTPGEFVIRKSSVQKLGAGNLAAMNENRYEKGGPMTVAQKLAMARGSQKIQKTEDKGKTKSYNDGQSAAIKFSVDDGSIGAFFMNKEGTPDGLKDFKKQKFTITNDKILSLPGISPKEVRPKDKQGRALPRLSGEKQKFTANGILEAGKISTFYPSIGDIKSGSLSQIVQNNVKSKLSEAVISVANEISSKKLLDIPPIDSNEALLSAAAQRIQSDAGAIKTTSGYLYEGVIDALTGARPASGNAVFDFPASSLQGNRSRLAALFGNQAGISKLKQADAKASYSSKIIDGDKGSISSKIINSINNGVLAGIKIQKKHLGGIIQKFATGGAVGTDTVPALLTPGEFVINRKSAQSIGYGSLNRMNKVGKYAKGGTVGFQRFAAGGKSVGNPTSVDLPFQKVSTNFSTLDKAIIKFASFLDKVTMGGSTKLGIVLESAVSSFQGVESSNEKYKRQLHYLNSVLPTFSNVLDSNAKHNRRSVVMQMELVSQISHGIKHLQDSGRSQQEVRRAAIDYANTLAKNSRDIIAAKSGAALTGSQQSSGSLPPAGFRPMGSPGSLPVMNAGPSTSPESTAVKDRSMQMATALAAAGTAIGYFQTEITESSSTAAIFTNNVLSTVQSLTLVAAALETFGIGLTKANIQSGLDSLVSKFPSLGTQLDKYGVTTANLASGLQAGAVAAAAVTAAFNILMSTVQESYRIEKERQMKVAQSSKLGSEDQKSAIDKAGKAASGEAGFGVRNTFGTIGAAIGGTIGAIGGGLAGATAGSIVPFAGTAAGAAVGGAAGGAGGAAAGAGVGVAIANFAGFTQEAATLAEAQTRIATIKLISDKEMAEASKDASKALKDFQDGTATAADVLKSTANAGQLLSAQREEVSKANEAEKANANAGGIMRTLGTYASLGYMDTNEERKTKADENSKIRNEELKKSVDNYIEMNQAGTSALARANAASGQSFDQFFNNLKATNAPLAEAYSSSEENLKQLEKEFSNIAKETERTRKAFEAMNLGFQGVNATASAMTVGLENYLASQEAGNIGLAQSLNTLQAGLTNAAQGISTEAFQGALTDAENALVSMGATDGEIGKFKENMTAINTAQKFYASATEDAKKNLMAEFKRGAAGTSDPGKRKEALSSAITAQLEGAGIGEEVRNRIGDALANADIKDEDLQSILSGNFEVLDKVLKDLGETTFGQVNKALEQYVKFQQQLVKLTQERIKIEGQLRDAQKSVVDAQLEAAKISQEFGGAAVTPDRSRKAIIDKANIDGQGLDVGTLKTGSADEIKNRQAKIRKELADIQNIRSGAAAGNKEDLAKLQGKEGARLADDEERLKKLAQENYNTTKALIDQKREEIKLIQAKNQLEKASMDALISGDIMKFFESQAAMGAQAALATGDQQLISQFDTASLGAATKDLEAQKEAGVQQRFGRDIGGAGGLVESGYAAIGGRAGVGMDTVQAAAKTTPEQLQAEKEARDLASTLPANMEILATSAQKDLEAADIQMKAAEKQLEAAKGEVGKSAQGPQPLARGGMVYASKGTLVNFKPKGTDTVPAMLTPGEFVVNRQAVQRGNNMAILSAMNKGKSAPAATGMSKGGQVKYMQTGGLAQGGGDSGVSINIDVKALQTFSASLVKFNDDLATNIQNLKDTKFQISLSPTNINVNLTGTSFLEQLTNTLKQELMSYVGREISQYTVGSDGKLKKSGSTLGTGL